MTVLNSAGLAEEALRTLGTYSPLDIGADPAEFSIALRRLNKVVAFLVATEKPDWFAPARQNISLVSGQREYSMQALLTNRLQYVRDVWLIDNSVSSTPRRTEMKLLTKDEYLEGLDRPTSGVPTGVYIPREEAPTLAVLPTVEDNNHILELNGFGYSGDLTQDGGINTHGFPEAWELAIAYLTAYDCGIGPITRLPRSDREDLRTEGRRMVRALRAFNDAPNVDQARRTQYRDL